MFQDRTELIAKLEELRFLMGDMPVRDVPTVAALWESWSKGMFEMKSDATKLSIKGSWKHLKPIIGTRTLDDITGEFWTNEIIPTVRARTHPGFKFFNMRKWLGMFSKWCEENRKGSRDWRKPRLVDPDPEIAKGRAYSIEETDRLYANADKILKPKLVMALEHFMRRSEIALCEMDFIDREKRIISLPARATKIRKARSFPYNDRLEAHFQELDETYGKDRKFLFPSPVNRDRSIGREGFSSAWASCKRRAGVVGKFHWLRHTALTRALGALGANVMVICEIAGLRVEEAQRTYMHVSEERKREEMSRLSIASREKRMDL